MKKIIITSLIAFTSIIGFAQTESSFGAKIETTTPAVATTEVKTVLGTTNETPTIKLTGQVLEVCQSKGCWMTVDAGNGEKMTVKFKDYAFFMPKDCAGKTVTFEGKATKKVITVAELKHLAEDAGKSRKEIKKIKKPKEELRFEASGVVLQG